MAGQQPSVGRIVHYRSLGSADGRYGPECRAAVITEVNEVGDTVHNVGLCVLNPTGQFFDRGVAYDEAGSPGTWHWPERV